MANAILVFDDWPSICVFCWLCFSLTIYTIAMASCLVFVDWRAVANAGFVRQHMYRAWSWFRAALLTKHQNDPVAEAAYKLFHRRQTAYIRCAVFALAPVLSMGNCFTLLWGLGVVKPHPDSRDVDLTDSHDIITALAPAFAAFFVCRKGQPGKAAASVLQVLVFAHLMWKLYSFSDDLNMLFDRSTSLLFRVVMVMMLTDVRLTTCLNSAYMAIALHKAKYFSSMEADIEEIGFSWFVYQELAALVVLVTLHAVMEWRMMSDARSTIEAKTSRNFISGLSKLLMTNYDVVVELDDKFALTADAKDLGSLLLLNPSRSLKGSTITDLMARDVDREAFAQHLAEDTSVEESPCHAIPHVFHMRDSCSTEVPVEMWHTRFEDLDSRSRHLVGIKEHPFEEHTPTVQPNTTQSRGAPKVTIGKASLSVARTKRPDAKPDVSDEQQPRQGQIAPQGQAPQAPGDGARVGCESDISSVSSGRSNQVPRSKLMLGDFQRTSVLAQRMSLMQMLTDWNIPVRPAACCPYHELLKEAGHVVKAMGRSRCNRIEHSPVSTFQCPSCGILAASQQLLNVDPRTRTCYLCRGLIDQNCNAEDDVAGSTRSAL